jgi:hypothetical protein
VVVDRDYEAAHYPLSISRALRIDTQHGDYPVAEDTGRQDVRLFGVER